MDIQLATITTNQLIPHKNEFNIEESNKNNKEN